MNEDDINRLEEIQNEMLKLIDEAEDILQNEGDITFERARSYWIAHIKTALTSEHDYVGGSMFTMESTIKELRGEEE